MNPPALYDALRYAARAVDEARRGHPVPALSTWMEAREAAGHAFDYGTAGSAALDAILGAAAPSAAWIPGRADLLRVLDTALLARLAAGEGDTGSAGMLLKDAAAAAAGLPCRESVAIILTALAASRDEVAA